jgi:two-component system sensor histidine kinase VicK
MLNSFFYFTVAYPSHKKTSSVFDAVFWSLTTIVFILTLTPLLVVGDIKIIDGFITGTLGPLMQYLTWYYLVLIFLSLFVLIFKIAKYKSIERVRLWYILIGFSIFAIPSVTTNVLLPIFFQKFQYNNLGPLFSFPMLVVISYAIVQYHLMDIRTLVRRGTVFTLLFVVLSAILVFGTSFLNNIMPFLPAQIATALIVALLFSPLKRILEMLTDRVFFRRPYHFEKELAELNHFIAHTYKLDDLVLHIVDRLSEVFKLDRAVLFLAEDTGTQYVVRSMRGEGFLPKNILATSPIARHLRENVGKSNNHENEVIERESIIREYSETNDGAIKERLGLLRDELDALGFQIAVPIFSKKDIVGILLLGEKKSQDPYSVQDLQFLDIVAHEISFSIENLLNIDRILKLDKAKSEFIMVVSHQLRTPLSIAKWNTEMLLDGGYGAIHEEKLEKGLEESYRAILKMNEGLNNLIMALQITEGGVALQKQNVDFEKEIVAPIVKDLREKAQEKKIAVTVRYEEGYQAVAVPCDASKIGFVFRSLVHNAIIYAPAESVVDIFIKKEKGKIVVSVDDLGIGVPHENYADIFQKFWRGGEARTTSPDGLGLSLFISRAFVAAHGGKLWIEEKNKPGARFVFSIPTKENTEIQ